MPSLVAPVAAMTNPPVVFLTGTAGGESPAPPSRWPGTAAPRKPAAQEGQRTDEARLTKARGQEVPLEQPHRESE